MLKNKILLIIFMAFLVMIPLQSESNVQVALLLDTSNSMDGLINQAKAKLWRIVNELSRVSYNDETPGFEVALYEYGKDSLPARENYLRMVVPFTKDLDKISDELFKLRTNGGSEFCGAVIHSAMKELIWSYNPEDLKIIYIAGNEPFNQGGIDYRKVCKRAHKSGVVINTIFCGNPDEGRETFWQNGAYLGGGDYLYINQDQDIVYYRSPYDDEIVDLGQRLNDTYIGYGSHGEAKMKMQAEQDKNAYSMDEEVMVNRSVTKANKLYKNEAWDMVDAVKENKIDLDKIPENELPEEMKKMTKDERVKYVKSLEKKRNDIQNRINDLNKKREEYIKNEQKKDKKKDTLDEAIIESVKKQAKEKNYRFK